MLKSSVEVRVLVNFTPVFLGSGFSKRLPSRLQETIRAVASNMISDLFIQGENLWFIVVYGGNDIGIAVLVLELF